MNEIMLIRSIGIVINIISVIESFDNSTIAILIIIEINRRDMK